MFDVNVVEIDRNALIYQIREMMRGNGARRCIVTPIQHYEAGQLVMSGTKLFACTKVERLNLYYASEKYYKECGYESVAEFAAAWRVNIAPFIACLDVAVQVFQQVEPGNRVSVTVFDEMDSPEIGAFVTAMVKRRRLDAVSECARQKFLDFVESLNDVASECGLTESERSAEGMERFVEAMKTIAVEPENGLFRAQFTANYERKHA